MPHHTVQPVQTFDTRLDMLSLIPKGGVIGEIGVFEGDFSQQLLDICRPRELVLFDLWPDCDVESGDVDGNNIRRVAGSELETKVRTRFAHDNRVRIVKGYSTSIRRYPRDSFDAVYIDGDHGYRGVRRDLMNCWRVVKDGGWLMGHDYAINPEKTASRYQFGVKAAVTDFCRDYAENIAGFGMDGCVGFAIQIHKRGTMRWPLILARRGLTDVRNLLGYARRLLPRPSRKRSSNSSPTRAS